MAKRRYVGATKLLDLAAAGRLGSRWVLQEKKDGAYVRVCLNSQGRVDRVFSRQDVEIHRDQLIGIRGAQLGRPHAEFIGELEAFTDAGRKAAADRGQPLVWLFDCLHDGTRSLLAEPYRARRDVLFRQQAEVECYGPRAPWLLDEHGRPRERSTGRYTYAKLMDWRVAPIIPQTPLSALGSEWERVVNGGDGEGLVAVNLDAKAGAPASKVKIKPYETIDCVVHSVSSSGVVCLWNGHAFVANKPKAVHVEVGNAVEVKHAGWYAHGVTPKFATVVRVRRDLLQ